MFGILKEKTENASANGNTKRVKIQNVSQTKMENQNFKKKIETLQDLGLGKEFLDLATKI